MYYLKVFPFYSILITIQSWVVIFFFGYGTFTETAVKAKMIPLTCTWQGFFFLWGLVFRVRQLLFFLSFGNRTVLKKFAIHQKYIRKIKFSKTHSKRARPPLSGQWGRCGGQYKRFCLSNVFPYCYRTCFACSWEQLHGARVFIKQVHSRFDRKIRIDSTVENTMCNLEYSSTVSQLFANGERSVFC